MDCNNPKDREEEWACKAKDKNGAQVLWIDQASDVLLKQENSKGVCFALTKDWVRSYRRYRIDRFKFVNSFRDTAQANPQNRIPGQYIELQRQYALGLQQQFVEKQQIMARLEKLKREGVETSPADTLAMLIAVNKQSYGSDLLDYKTYRLKDIFDVSVIVEEMKVAGKKTPRYYMLSFSKKGEGGHVVGFEFRPDVHVSDTFPQLHEFIDANLGLYAFGSIDNMIDFFNEDVWLDMYGVKNYDRFELATFDTGLGGLGKTWTEWLNEWIDWFKSWVV